MECFVKIGYGLLKVIGKHLASSSIGTVLHLNCRAVCILQPFLMRS